MRIKNPEVLARLEELKQNRCPDGTLDDVLVTLLLDSSLLEEVMRCLTARGEAVLADVANDDALEYRAGAVEVVPLGVASAQCPCSPTYTGPHRFTIDLGDAPPSPELLDFPRPMGVVQAERDRRRA